jgi:hypothetical protein
MKKLGIALRLNRKPLNLFSKVAVRNTWTGNTVNNTGLSEDGLDHLCLEQVYAE